MSEVEVEYSCEVIKQLQRAFLCVLPPRHHKALGLRGEKIKVKANRLRCFTASSAEES